MRRVNKTLVAFLLTGLWSAAGLAQDGVYVAIETNMPDALVYSDSLRVGLASQGPFLLPAHAKRVRLVPAVVDTWSIQPVEVALDAVAGDTVQLQMFFPYHYQVDSLPFGATVYMEEQGRRKALGKTPVLYRTAVPLTDTLVVERKGYIAAELIPGREVWNHHVVTLEPLRQALETQEPAEMVWSPPKRAHRWIDYAAAGLAVTAGVVAIHNKFKADRLYEEYKETGDPELRPRINRYDTQSAVALGAMQVGLGVLTIRFAFR